MDESELAALQSALVHALSRASTPDEAQSLLVEAALSESARRWLARSDPRAIETAIEIIGRWSERDEEAAPEA